MAIIREAGTQLDTIRPEGWPVWSRFLVSRWRGDDDPRIGSFGAAPIVGNMVRRLLRLAREIYAKYGLGGTRVVPTAV